MLTLDELRTWPRERLAVLGWREILAMAPQERQRASYLRGAAWHAELVARQPVQLCFNFDEADEAECDTCNGDNTVECEDCDGSDENCDTCDGTGDQPCPDC